MGKKIRPNIFIGGGEVIENRSLSWQGPELNSGKNQNLNSDF